MNTQKISSHKILFFTVILLMVFSFIVPVDKAKAQNRDHLTAEEIEVVRDVQEIDKRMLVFVYAIERRFIVLDGIDKLDAKQLKRIEKDKEIWGELPKGTQTQMLSDIDEILEEAVNKIEDVAERDMKSELFPVAVHVLADYAISLIPHLEKYKEKSISSRETALINSATQNCKDIIESSAKVPRPDEKFMKKRTKKIGHTRPPF